MPDLVLPEKSNDNETVISYLSGRGIDQEIIDYCIQEGLIFESLPYHDVVFVGYNEKHQPKFATSRSTNKHRIMRESPWSKREYSFRLADGEGDTLYLFEGAIDLLSYATLLKISGEEWHNYNLISLSGVYPLFPSLSNPKTQIPPSIRKFLNQNDSILKIYVCSDNNPPGRKIAETLEIVLQSKYEVIYMPPPDGKDYNEFLCKQLENKG